MWIDKLEKEFGFVTVAHFGPLFPASADREAVMGEKIQAGSVALQDVAPELVQTDGFKGIFYHAGQGSRSVSLLPVRLISNEDTNTGTIVILIKVV